METLRIGFKNSSPPFVGRTFEALRAICDANSSLNCIFSIYPTTEYGFIYENGTATGMLGSVQNRQFDTFEPFFAPTYDRARVFDFSETVFYSDILLATRFPQDDSSNQTASTSWRSLNFNFLTFIKPEIWILFLVSIIWIAFFLHFASNENFYEFSWENFLDGFKKRFESMTLLNRIGTLITQKYDDRLLNSSTNSIKILITFWSLALMVLSSSYTSILFDSKIQNTKTLPFRNFEQLIECLNEDRCGLIVREISASYVQNILTRRKNNSNWFVVAKPAQEISRQILNDHERYLVWIDTRNLMDQYLPQRNNCDFYITLAPFKDVWTFPLRKNSHWKPILDRATIAFRESGLGEMISKKYQQDWTKCEQKLLSTTSRTSLEPTEFHHAIFVLFAFATLGSTLGLVGELIWWKWYIRVERRVRVDSINI